MVVYGLLRGKKKEEIPRWCESDALITISDVLPDEIKEQKQKEIDTKKIIESKENRERLLKKGTISADGRMWFNFDSADMFMNAVGTLDPGETIKWYDKDRQVVELTYEEAKAYAKEIRLVMQSLYGLEG